MKKNPTLKKPPPNKKKPLFLCKPSVNESIKNNIQSSIFLLFLRHCTTFWKDITWSLLQSKRTRRGKPAVDFLETSTLLLLCSPKSQQCCRLLFTSTHFLLILVITIPLKLIKLLQNKQWNKRHICPVYLFLPQVYLSLFSLLHPSLIFFWPLYFIDFTCEQIFHHGLL